MAAASDILQQAAACRDLAQRARRLAAGLLNETDQARLMRYGVELEEQASTLEREATNLEPVSRQP
jgi:hypothetical protein